MLYSFITIYTSDLWISMLFGVLVFLCSSVFASEQNKLPQINNVIHITPVVSDTVFAGRQDRTMRYKAVIILHKTHFKYLIRNSRHRLG